MGSRWRCGACGTEQPGHAKVCNECGTTLAERQQPVANNLTTNNVPFAERRQLTVLFCDLVGSTPLSQQLDAEEWRDIIAQYQQAASGAVVRFGGWPVVEAVKLLVVRLLGKDEPYRRRVLP